MGPGAELRCGALGFPGAPEICSRNDNRCEARLLFMADGPQPSSLHHASKTHMARMGAVLFPFPAEKRIPGELGDLPKVTSLVSGQARIRTQSCVASKPGAQQKTKADKLGSESHFLQVLFPFFFAKQTSERKKKVRSKWPQCVPGLFSARLGVGFSRQQTGNAPATAAAPTTRQGGLPCLSQPSRASRFTFQLRRSI